MTDSDSGLDPTKARLCRRQPVEYLAILSGRGGAQVLCRVLDLGEGGARLCVSADDAGPAGEPVRIELLDAGLHGAWLALRGRVAWSGHGEAGIEWIAADALARSAVAHLAGGPGDAAGLARSG